MEFLQLLIDNGDNIIASIGALLSAFVGILTLVQRFMPDVIESNTLAKIEAFTSKFSLGTKKAEVKKK